MEGITRSEEQVALRKQWLVGRVFWLVQDGHTWEVEILSTNPHPKSGSEWSMFASIQGGDRVPDVGDAMLYPHELFASILLCGNNPKGGYLLRLATAIPRSQWRSLLPEAA
jgi:hypothetical protein